MGLPQSIPTIGTVTPVSCKVPYRVRHGLWFLLHYMPLELQQANKFTAPPQTKSCLISVGVGL
jgi:hypothetical protein